MSSETWVCFHCRTATRREKHEGSAARCPECSRACTNLGQRLRIPTRDDRRAWEDLQERIFQESAARRMRQAVLKARTRHGLERQIAELEGREENPGRRRMIEQLRGRLDGLGQA